MLEKLTRTRPGTLHLWMISAAIAGAGAGMLLPVNLPSLALLLLGIGAVLHGWAMYRIYLAKE